MKQATVVIPVYNREHLIERALDSVASQTRLPSRLVVVDNNSTDGTLKVVEEWMKRQAGTGLDLKLVSEKTPGASAARNRGLKEVETDYVYFLDSDDEMNPHLLEEALNAVQDAYLVFWKGEYVALDGSRRLKPFHKDSLLRRQFYNSILSTQCYLVRTDLVRSVGGWNEEAKVWNDWDLGVRLALQEPKAVALDKTLVTIHAQKESITGECFSQRKYDWENTIGIVETYIYNLDCDEKTKTRLYDMVDYRRIILSAHLYREGKRDHSLALKRFALELERPLWRKLLLKLFWAYTVKGGRGAYYLWR